MRIATSLISIEQAQHNLALEIAPTDTFETVRERAQQAVGRQARRRSRSRAPPRTSSPRCTRTSTGCSCIRTRRYENMGTAAAPGLPARRPVLDLDRRPSTRDPDRRARRRRQGLRQQRLLGHLPDGLARLLAALPGSAGELVDGFVQQYRDGGWVSRWSSPGYANLMTGTSSDVAFADAYVKGVTQLRRRATPTTPPLKNATVAPPGVDPNNTSVGRKGLETVDLPRLHAVGGVRGRLVGARGLHQRLRHRQHGEGAGRRPGRQRADRRALPRGARVLPRARPQLREHVRPGDRLLPGPHAPTASWKSTPEEYDPRVWGHDHDYTETNGWNFAFHVPHDGQGLANLYGGRDDLAGKLDTFFSTPETAKFPGSYGGVIHEMLEARDVRMGQWGFSNQVSHHIPYMYAYAAQPSKTQEKVREVLRRMYLGSEIGQGYAGDEDNGETSAWYLFSALGFYPLQVGSPNYVIGSPLFKKATST